jgi:alpha-amylase
MTRRCNAVGVRIYPDILLNHMSATTGPGTGSSSAQTNTSYQNYPAVPFTTEHFNPYCSLDWNSQTSVRDCWLIGLPDLNLKHQHVRDMQVALLNKLIDLGVAGFRLDAMKVVIFLFIFIFIFIFISIYIYIYFLLYQAHVA